MLTHKSHSSAQDEDLKLNRFMTQEQQCGMELLLQLTVKDHGLQHSVCVGGGILYFTSFCSSGNVQITGMARLKM